ncbi:MAG: hypothetical protein GEU93_16640 [Propionibacteriales bacterium]|nr:hypothetical protein [Propionibacteriales bacterium]
MRQSEYETLVLISGGRSTLDHLVQAFDIHTPQARSLVNELEAQGLIETTSEWCAGSLCYQTTARGKQVLEQQEPDGARGAKTLAADESAVLDGIARTGTLPESTDLHWSASSTVQYLWETGAIAVSGMLRPQLAIEGSR